MVTFERKPPSKNMTRKEKVLELIELKSKVTKLGMDSVQNKLPIPIPEFQKLLEPYCIIERAFDEAIKTLENE